jgi:hypothetical protein
VGRTEDNSFWNLSETSPEVALLEVNMLGSGNGSCSYEHHAIHAPGSIGLHRRD